MGKVRCGNAITATLPANVSSRWPCHDSSSQAGSAHNLVSTNKDPTCRKYRARCIRTFSRDFLDTIDCTRTRPPKFVEPCGKLAGQTLARNLMRSSVFWVKCHRGQTGTNPAPTNRLILRRNGVHGSYQVFRTERAWSPSFSVFPCLVLFTFSPYTDRSLYLTACNMPGLAVMHPIHFLPLTPPSSAPSTIATIDSLSLSDCELLQRRPSLSIPLLSPLDPISFPEKPFPFASSSEPPEVGEPAASNAFVPVNDIHAIPASHHSCTTLLPPLYAMHPPLTSTQRSHFSSYRFRIRPTPKSTLSFKVAAPAPRIPLATVLQYWGANDTHPRQDPGPSVAHADVRMEVDMDERVYEDGFRKPGLGLVLGLTPSPGPQSRPYPDPHAHAHTHSQSQSQSRSRYSRRLRRLAPAALPLTPPTRRRALLAPAASPSASAPQPANPQHTPVSGVFVDIPLATCPGPSCSFDLDRLPAIPSVDYTQAKSPSVSPETDRIAGPSLSSAKATMSTAPTSLVFPSGDSENHMSNAHTHAPTDATVDTWYVEMLSWRHTVSRALDSPLSLVRTPKSAKCMAHASSMSTATTPLRSAAGAVFGNLSQLTPGLPHDTTPPPPPRMGCNPLPELADNLPPPPPQPAFAEEEEQLVYPQHADLTWELDTESLVLWAEKCSETIARASLSLRSCGLLKDPDAIAALCDDLRRTFATVQLALEDTPRDFVMDGSEARQTWYTNHCDAVHSLSRNMQHFHMLARRVEDRPPRIHRLEGVLQKLATYQVKFTDIARRISVSHEKLRLLDLRTELARAHTRARVRAVEERRRRREERAVRQEGRTRCHALREEIRRVRGAIRTMRHAAPQHDENAFFFRSMDEDGDDNMLGEPYGSSGAKWRFNAS
ncbi:hypothetical protein LXA43DRAFT_1034312 [Ganoderma leucocontextum]|nr:hypothetical protein LXA43DRAFT_1034312 [Ganoderma leucocontextum]